MTRRRVAIALLATALGLLAGPPALRAELRYRVHDLGTLGGNASFALDVNNRRHVTGNARTATTTLPLLGFLWDEGGMTSLGILPGSNPFSRGYGINDAGVIVGESDNNVPHAFRWQSGVLEDLGTLGGSSAVAHGINEAGQIAGASSNGQNSRPFLWTDGVMRDLGTLVGTTGSPGRAWALNDAGDVVGFSRAIDATFTSQATRWRVDAAGFPVAVENLGSLGDGAQFSEALAVADNGWIVGRSVVTGSTEHAVLWRDGAIQDLGTLGFAHSRALDVNAHGQVVGHVSGFAGFPTIDGRAVLWQAGAAIDLNTLIPDDSGWVLRSAEGINDNGDIVGFGTRTGETRAFLLTPLARFCHALGDDRSRLWPDEDTFSFEGVRGERVIIGLDRDPAASSTGERASLLVFNAQRGAPVIRVDSGLLPNEVALTLPRSGRYLVSVTQPLFFSPGRRFQGAYCLTLESSGPAPLTLRGMESAEPRSP